MPSAPSSTAPPDVPENAPSPASSAVSSQPPAAPPSQKAPDTSTVPATPAARPSRLIAYAHRAWRATHAWLAPAPAATAAAALTLLIGLVLLPWGHRGQIALSAYIHQPQRVWTLLTAWAAPGHLLPV